LPTESRATSCNARITFGRERPFILASTETNKATKASSILGEEPRIVIVDIRLEGRQWSIVVIINNVIRTTDLWMKGVDQKKCIFVTQSWNARMAWGRGGNLNET
jgi:hypothetical protein